MADAGLFIGWGEVVRGREAEALEIFNSTLEYFGGLQAEGTIESFEPVFLEPHGGDLQRLLLPPRRGREARGASSDDEFQATIIRAGLIVDNLGVVGASMGARLERQMGAYTEQIAAFA